MLNWNQEKNIITINKEPKEQKKKLKAFMIHIAQNQKELEEMQNGTHSGKVNLCPVFAENSTLALQSVEEKGQIALSIVPFEFLELQVKLINDSAEQFNIEIDRSMEIQLDSKI